MSTAPPAFTPMDAHNGCRALFNGTKGWAYIGPAGPINPVDFPGTVSYDCKRTPGAASTTSGARKHPPAAHGGSPSAPRPGEGCRRKTSDVHSAYLDAADLEHLVQEADRFAFPSSAAVGGEEGRARRRGRPIVLTLQAILAGTAVTPAPVSTTAAASAEAGEHGERSRRSGSVLAPAEEKAHESSGGGGGGGCGDKLGADSDCDSETHSDVPEAADHEHFPPLTLRGVSVEKNGLFLAPPITMVKKPPAAGWGGLREGRESGGVSCSEALAATSLAEAAQAGGAGAGAAAGVSTVGWWLRWATAAADPSCGGDGAAAAALGDESEGRGAGFSPPTAIGMEEGDGEEKNAVCETTVGDDGWQVLSLGTQPEPAIGAGAREEPAEVAPRRKPAAATAAAAAAAAASGAWALVTWSGTRATPAGGVGAKAGVGDGEDDAASWCDCASEGDEVEVGMLSRDDEIASGGASSGGEGAAAALGTAADPSAPALAEAASIEVALHRAVNSNAWDGNEDGNEQRPHSPASSTTTESPPSERFDETAKENIPRTFRDMLMAPSSTGATCFSDCPALRARAAPATSSSSSSGPTLVDGGSRGGAVYLWKKAAAGKGGKAADRQLGRDDEDPYYARKRVGAFAFRTKPRGKAHK